MAEIVSMISGGKIFTATLLDGSKATLQALKDGQTEDDTKIRVRPMNWQLKIKELDLTKVAKIKYSGAEYELQPLAPKEEATAVKQLKAVKTASTPKSNAVVAGIDPLLAEILSVEERETFIYLKEKNKKMTFLLNRDVNFHLIKQVCNVHYTAVNRQDRINRGLSLPNGKPTADVVAKKMEEERRARVGQGQTTEA
jgi:hypothetical protein